MPVSLRDLANFAFRFVHKSKHQNRKHYDPAAVKKARKLARKQRARNRR